MFGLGFYIGSLVALVRYRLDRDVWAPRLLLGVYTLSCLYSLFLGGISAFVLQSFCWACTSLYVVNIAGLVLSRMLSDKGYLATYASLGRNIIQLGGSLTLFWFVASFLAGALGSWVIGEEVGSRLDKGDGDHSAQAEAWVLETFSHTEPVSDELRALLEQEGHYKGPENPEVVVVEFSDFECPFCSRVAPFMSQIVQEFPGKVGVYFRHNPLDEHCNPRIKKKFHPHACQASFAAVCADEQGKFWPMHDMLYANRKKLGNKSLASYAKALQLEETAFRDCLLGERAKNKIKKELKTARKAKVRGTPTLFVNGRRIKGAVPFWKLKAAVEYELEQGGR